MPRNSWKAAAAMALIATGSGCSWFEPRVVTVCEPLPEPARPVLPAITAADLQCVSIGAYRRVLIRDLTRRQYAEELEVIIQEHNTGCETE